MICLTIVSNFSDTWMFDAIHFKDPHLFLQNSPLGLSIHLSVLVSAQQPYFWVQLELHPFFPGSAVHLVSGWTVRVREDHAEATSIEWFGSSILINHPSWNNDWPPCKGWFIRIEGLNNQAIQCYFIRSLLPNWIHVGNITYSWKCSHMISYSSFLLSLLVDYFSIYFGYSLTTAALSYSLSLTTSVRAWWLRCTSASKYRASTWWRYHSQYDKVIYGEVHNLLWGFWKFSWNKNSSLGAW